jgi:amino acid transporter
MPVPADRRRLRFLPLVAATFFIVSGGPYGLEEIVLGHGYAGALGLLAVVPLVWSLPVALLVGELGAALPRTGGFTVWVTRGLGRFWGLQEAWLSSAVGIVDIAIYPTLLVTYLSRLFPALGGDAPGQPGWWLGMGLIAAGTLWNAMGIRSVGLGSLGLGAVLLAPFAAIAAMAMGSLPNGGAATAAVALAVPPPADAPAWIAGLLLAMWNLMGFDNASTFAAEVEDPQRSYPRAMLLATALIAASYLATVLAAAASGLPAAQWTAGSFVEVGRRLGGERLAWLVTAGGAVSAAGMYVALLLSWSRLPVAMAHDGWLPAALARRQPASGAPVPALLLGGALSGLCLGVGLRRLVEIDVLLYGAALLLEFAALVALRVRQPGLHRPFRVPGGVAGCVALSLPPLALLAAAAWLGRDEPGALGLTAPGLALAVAAVGPAWWLLAALGKRWGPGARAQVDPGEGAP